jgi:hypothetical protein
LETFNQTIEWVQLVLMTEIPGVCCVSVYYTEGHWFVKQEMLTIPEYMSSPPGFQWISRCSTCVMLCRSLFVLFPLAILSPVLRFTASDYLFGILKLFFAPLRWCLFLSRNRISISRSRSKNCLWKKIHFIYKISDICK